MYHVLTGNIFVLQCVTLSDMYVYCLHVADPKKRIQVS